MTKREDDERMRQIEADHLAKAIYDTIDSLPHATRLYPDMYALKVAAAVRQAQQEARSVLVARFNASRAETETLETLYATEPPQELTTA
jgi:hypothetical protein